jgi:hypothetical protein
MIFSSGDLRDDRVWQKAGANTRMFGDWIETQRTVWNKLRVFQVDEFALRVLLESPTKAYTKDRLTLRLKVLPRWAESSPNAEARGKGVAGSERGRRSCQT